MKFYQVLPFLWVIFDCHDQGTYIDSSIILFYFIFFSWISDFPLFLKCKVTTPDSLGFWVWGKIVCFLSSDFVIFLFFLRNFVAFCYNFLLWSDSVCVCTLQKSNEIPSSLVHFFCYNIVCIIAINSKIVVIMIYATPLLKKHNNVLNKSSSFSLFMFDWFKLLVYWTIGQWINWVSLSELWSV